MTNFVHGLMMGYLRRSTSFVSFLIGLCDIFLAFHQRFCARSSPVCDWFSVPYLFLSGSFCWICLTQCFNFVVDCLLRIHCVTSWGVHTAISAGGSVVSATFASMATGCGGGMLATLLLDDSSSVWMDKVTRVLVKYKRWRSQSDAICRELEHLMTLSLLYQVLIGFLPLSFVSPIDFVGVEKDCDVDKREKRVLCCLFVPSFCGKSDWDCNRCGCALWIAFVSSHSDDRFVFEGGRDRERKGERRIECLFVRVAFFLLVCRSHTIHFYPYLSISIHFQNQVILASFHHSHAFNYCQTNRWVVLDVHPKYFTIFLWYVAGG